MMKFSLAAFHQVPLDCFPVVVTDFGVGRWSFFISLFVVGFFFCCLFVFFQLGEWLFLVSMFVIFLFHIKAGNTVQGTEKMMATGTDEERGQQCPSQETRLVRAAW